MKLFKAARNYGKINIIEMVWAESPEEVYSLLDWELKDKPELKIEEIIPRKGCFLSVSTHDKF